MSALLQQHGLAATPHSGQVTFGGLPVPGAAVTASQGDKQFSATTDPQGVFRLADLTDGVWSIRIEMQGFATLMQDVTVGPNTPPSMWELKLLTFDEIARDIPPAPAPSPAPASTAAPSGKPAATSPNPSGAFQRAGVNAAANAPAAANPANPANSANPANPANPTNPANPIVPPTASWSTAA